MVCVSVPAFIAADASIGAATMAATLPEVVTVTGALAGAGGLGTLGTLGLAGAAGVAGAGAAGAFGGGGAGGGAGAASGGTPPGWASHRPPAPPTASSNQLYDPRYFAQGDVPGGAMDPVSMQDAQAWGANYGSGLNTEVVGSAPGIGGAGTGAVAPAVAGAGALSGLSDLNPLITGAAAGASAAALSPNLTGFSSTDPNASFFDKYGQPLATIGSSLINAGGSLIASNTAADAQKQALALQKQAQDNAMQIFNTGQKNLQPFMTGGAADFEAYNRMMGLPAGSTDPNATGGATADNRLAMLENTPGFRFQRDQGLLSIQNAFAAKGLGATGPQVGPNGSITGGNGPSGALLRGGIDYNQGLAGTYYDNYIKSLMAGSSLGENAAAGFGNNAVGAGGNLVQFGNNAGQAQANVGAYQGAGQYGAFQNIGAGLTSGTYGLTNPLVNPNGYMYPYNPNTA